MDVSAPRDRLSHSWALRVKTPDKAQLTPEQARGLAYAERIARNARRRRKAISEGVFAFPKHTPSEENEFFHLDRDGDYFFDYASARRACWCPRCKEHSEPEIEGDGVWFRPRTCPLPWCDGWEFPPKPEPRAPRKVTPASIAREERIEVAEVERLIAAAREAIFPGLGDRGIRRLTEKKRRPKRPTKCADCGKRLPKDTRAPSDPGTPKRYCAACDTGAARQRRYRTAKKAATAS